MIRGALSASLIYKGVYRVKRKHNTFLADDDKYVPDGYISITELFSDGAYALPGYDPDNWCIGTKKLQEMRRNTFLEVKKRFEISYVSKFGNFWNNNLDTLNSLGINQFSKLSCFRDLAHLMICFDTMILTHDKSHKNDYVSFGIKETLYRKYSMAMKEAIESGETFKIPALYDAHKRRSSTITTLPKAHIQIKSNDPKHPYSIDIDKNELFLEFERWCKAHMLKKQDALYKGMQMLMKENPIEEGQNFKNIIVSEPSNHSNIQESIYISDSTERINMVATVPANVNELAKAIVKRYNRDPENIGKKKLTLGMYAGQAIAAFNKSVPLKYSDPVAYKEYIDALKSKEYNNKSEE